MTTLVDDQYPNIAWWVTDGRIEIGRDEYNNSLICVLDQGGLVWQSDEAYETIAEALAEAALGRWAKEHGYYLLLVERSCKIRCK